MTSMPERTTGGAAGVAVSDKRPAIVAGGLSEVGRTGSGRTILDGKTSSKTFRHEGRQIIEEPLERWRANASRLGIAQLKSLIMRIQVAINAFDFSKQVSDADRLDNEAALEALVRRQAILQHILIARGYHKQSDSGDFNKWLDGAKPKRVF